jgi:DNA-directed RNA polymerase specialized sigma24 family protein
MRIQYNLFIDNARRRRREQSVSLDDAGIANLPGDARFEPERRAEHDERLMLLERVWPRLGTDQQVVLALRAEGYSLAEMQEITGFGNDVLNMRLHRARQRLARLLEREEAAGIPVTREVLP